MSKPAIGAQLYTLKLFTKTAPELFQAMKKVAAIGYRNVQVSGIGPIPPADVARAAADCGLAIVSTHTAWTRFQNELDKVIEEHKLWKCPHPAIGGLPKTYFTEDGLKQFLAELAPIARKLAGAGMDFSYHNHSHELAKYSGKTWLELLYGNSDPAMLKAEIDTYWIAHGGGDPACWVRRCANRMPLLHCKDMIITPDRQQKFAEVGEGNLNWKAILAEAEKAGVEYLLVEQDDCYGKDPFEALAASYRNLASWGYK